MKNVNKLKKIEINEPPKEYVFSNPNLKYKEIISDNIFNGGIFEIFTSLKNKELYLAIPNKDYIVDIILLQNNQLVNSLKGHKYYVKICKYFQNKYKKNEYLISSDIENVVIIWDITNNYSIYDKICDYKTSLGYISAIICLNNINFKDKKDDYLIFAFNCRYYTYVYSLNNKQKAGIIDKTNEHNTYYLLLWFNKRDINNYLIELSENIFIYNIKENKLYYIVKVGDYNNSKTNSGFIYNKNNNDYLFFSCNSGIIYQLNLQTKEINKIFSIKFYNKEKIYFSYLVQWSNKYMIVCEYYNKGFKIIEIEDDNKFRIVSSIRGKHSGFIIYAKKFFHPIYRESLLTSGTDNTVILWSKNY